MRPLCLVASLTRGVRGLVVIAAIGSMALVDPAFPQSTSPTDTLPGGSTTSKTWPNPDVLLEELAAIRSPIVVPWANRAAATLEGVAGVPSLADPSILPLLDELERCAAEGESMADHAEDFDEQSRIRIASYAIDRRVHLWRAAFRASQPDVRQRIALSRITWNRERIASLVSELENWLTTSPNGQNWTAFLGLDPLRTAMAGTSPEFPAPDSIARRVLLNLEKVEYSPQQEKFLSSELLVQWVSALRALTDQELDLADVLHQVERLEATRSPFVASHLAQSWNCLRWSEVPEFRQVADVLDHHYRNANIRLSMTERFANRFLPEMQHVRAPVREQILGADVQGQSDSLTQLRVRLVPDPDEIRIKLEADGVMASKTQSTRGGITVLNRNRSRFILQKLFTMDPYGVSVGRTRASAVVNSDLLGIRTKYDAFPILGTMVSRAAKQQHDESRYMTRMIVGDRIATRVKQKIDSQLGDELEKAQQRLQQNVIRPLEDMDLSPQALAMHTSADRLVLRGRLAGTEQLAAFTARPRAPANNLVSIQVHESALNNFFDQMGLGGRDVELRALIREILDQWGMKSVTIPDDVPQGVLMEMVDHHPVQVHCQDDHIRFELLLKKLTFEDKTWRNFKIAANYTPATNGFQCELRRDGCVELQSLTRRALGCSSQVALRGIFTRALSKNRSIELIRAELAQQERLADLRVDQCLIRNGWIGLSVGEDPKVLQMTRRPSPNPATKSLRR